ncbi:hypothetical protein SS1G_12472 [Sclerotinia sclerotiorum 1980 UF-70]|uniref:HTH psq-type domain-containing protein n=1 Tax=Sclerotinia sclerotiorum (strain ATCC 18683 / 1980 / Ss-1) TaxID=665079 RepID=A7F4E7_SCLS1|nr:hypothetical protein SS1G_12472 [Sclerotinia sclerotiorum 1980 UF-70]EDN97618.1 hypothetical protein SS1G_12472 [Sclerotinia sclerotiorum 1980 UF-70]
MQESQINLAIQAIASSKKLSVRRAAKIYCDFYNFDETGFMMGQISPHIVVTKADRYGKSKAIQSGNRE